MGTLDQIYEIAETSITELQEAISRKNLTQKEKIEFFEEFKDDIIEMLDVKIALIKSLGGKRND